MKESFLSDFTWTFDGAVLSKQLEFIGEEALPRATARTLNAVAHQAMRQAQDNAKRRLTIRTKYTINGIVQDRRARGADVGRMWARVRVRNKYMVRQNQGHKFNRAGYGYPIAPISARTSRSYGRSVAGRFRYKSMGDDAERPGGRFFTGRPHHSRTFGVWYRKSKKRLVLIRRLGHLSVNVPATRFFDDATVEAGGNQNMARKFRAAARVEIRRRWPRQ